MSNAAYIVLGSWLMLICAFGYGYNELKREGHIGPASHPSVADQRALTKLIQHKLGR